MSELFFVRLDPAWTKRECGLFGSGLVLGVVGDSLTGFTRQWADVQGWGVKAGTGYVVEVLPGDRIIMPKGEVALNDADLAFAWSLLDVIICEDTSWEGFDQAQACGVIPVVVAPEGERQAELFSRLDDLVSKGREEIRVLSRQARRAGLEAGVESWFLQAQDLADIRLYRKNVFHFFKFTSWHKLRLLLSREVYLGGAYSNIQQAIEFLSDRTVVNVEVDYNKDVLLLREAVDLERVDRFICTMPEQYVALRNQLGDDPRIINAPVLMHGTPIEQLQSLDLSSLSVPSLGEKIRIGVSAHAYGNESALDGALDVVEQLLARGIDASLCFYPTLEQAQARLHSKDDDSFAIYWSLQERLKQCPQLNERVSELDGSWQRYCEQIDVFISMAATIYPYELMEAAAQGVPVASISWDGADLIYPQSVLATNIDELVDLISKA
ncbi:hypothetical protein SAMN04489737_0312 [Arcanobacterium phocae]|uniref:Uncharacterized protein n=1 Tax=Arcanobacterium phocae TaxID=131112 RepID=A0A1H2LAX7_9ACTO|nr:hypothetical protein [Arcanobacterium phocae]SDU78079.1 hypothetical protein SAMN04489737_0312 [Arcanobacterium phocae]